MDKILLTKEVAQILRISEDHVRVLIRQRLIKAYKEGRRGGYRIPQDEIENYIKGKRAEC